MPAAVPWGNWAMVGGASGFRLSCEFWAWAVCSLGSSGVCSLGRAVLWRLRAVKLVCWGLR